MAAMDQRIGARRQISADSVPQGPFRSVEELDMKRIIVAAIIAASTLASSAAFAGRGHIGPTRAQARTVLAQAQQDGLFNTPDATYPAVQLRAAEKGVAASSGVGTADVGGTVASRVQSGHRTVVAPVARDRIYFGH